MTEKTVSIGGASGAWGDSPRAIPQLLKADIQYLMMDYLAEVTMSLLAKSRLKDPNAGFPPDFVAYLKPHLKEIARRGIKVLSNAGGVNPSACKEAIEAFCAANEIQLKVAVVLGDDLMPSIEKLRADGVQEAVSGKTLPETLLTANAYLGALPIKAALDQGADIVITGRCVDSALALGALMHEYAWQDDQYDLLAAGSLVGHLLECGPQSTGGVFTDWESVPDWHNIGYPIAICHANGDFELTKAENTGGMVTVATVSEQTLYEVSDPAAYILPDVIADFSQLQLTQVKPDCVAIRGVKGAAPTQQYKVSATYLDGYRTVALVAIVGFQAVAKAQRTAQALLARGNDILQETGAAPFSAHHIEVLGSEASYGTQSGCQASREVILRLVLEHKDSKVLQLLAREMGSVGLSFAQGTTGLIGGRPKPTQVVRLFTFFINKDQLDLPTVQLGQESAFPVTVPAGQAGFAPRAGTSGQALQEASESAQGIEGRSVQVPLIRLAYARSGDKGNLSNIAIFSREPQYFEFLKKVLTTELISEHFKEVSFGAVERYEAPGLQALNFILHDALGGGGMASMRIDPQGKAYGQRALELMVSIPASWNLH